MVDYDKSPNGYKRYQDWFSTRKVGAYNHGVPDFDGDIEGIAEDIGRTPWENLKDGEKVAVANIAMDATKAVCRMSIKQGDIDKDKATGVMMDIAIILFNAILGVEDPFEEYRLNGPFDGIDL